MKSYPPSLGGNVDKLAAGSSALQNALFVQFFPPFLRTQFALGGLVCEYHFSTRAFSCQPLKFLRRFTTFAIA